MLYVDKHRPTQFDRMDYHKDLSDRLIHLANSNEFPHLLVYGPSGAGKKTRVLALLRELYGPNVLKLRLEHKTFQVPNTSTKMELTTVASNYHIEINPSDAGNKDRFIIQEVLKEIAAYNLMDTKARKPFKVVVLNEVDKLSKMAQHALRRTMEKYTATCRLILCCNNSSNLIDPLKSRCVGIRVSAPTHDEIAQVLANICHKECIKYTDASFLMKIAKQSDRNLRRAILMLEASKVDKVPLTPDQTIQTPDWELFLENIASMMLREQSPAGLLKVREKLYELLANCIPAETILKTLCLRLMVRIDDELKPDLVHWAAYYEHRISMGNKDIFHLEAFVAKFMAIYKKFLLDMYA